MSFHRREGFVRKLTSLSVCFHRVVCSFFMSASISVLSVCMRAIVSGVGGRARRCLRVCILCLIWRL